MHLFLETLPTMSWTPHITVASIVEDKGHFLMVEELSEGEKVFNQPAGHLESNETLIEAAVRETLEETGWHITITAFLGIYQLKTKAGDTYLRHCFIGSPDKHEPERPLDDDIIAAHWFTPQAILSDGFAKRSPLVPQAILDYQSGQRYPLDLYHGEVSL